MPHDPNARPTVLISTSTNNRTAGLYRLDTVTGLNYAEAVAHGGGLPLLAPTLEPALAEAYVARADALLLSGGGDPDPELFDEAPHPDLGEVDARRDAFEIALYRAARAADKPVLGICRGVQLLNVAEGGSLVQHVPALAHTVQHEQVERSGAPLHPIELAPDSALARAFGATRVKVNSYHHQAVGRLGAGLRVVATTSDGVVEAVEGTSGAFLLGVQWHPEMSFARFPEQFAPFRAFFEALTRRPLAV